MTMNKVVLFGFACLLSSTVLAFGGGAGRSRAAYYERHKSGVDSFAPHFGGEGQVDIDFVNPDDPNAYADELGVYHCKAGYIPEDKVCVACAAGTYAPAASSSCKSAEPGYYVKESAAADQTPCEPGYYTNKSGAIDPIPADEGYYVSSAKATKQTIAQPGYYTNTTAATQPIAAQPGYYVAASGATEQTITQPGYYTNTTAATQPIAAQPGYYVAESGATEQTITQPGYYTNTTAATQPTAAQPGYYVAESGATEQEKCPAGTYSDKEAATSCKTVSAGQQPVGDPPTAQGPCTDTDTLGACGCGAQQYADGNGGCVNAVCREYETEGGGTKMTHCCHTGEQSYCKDYSWLSPSETGLEDMVRGCFRMACAPASYTCYDAAVQDGAQGICCPQGQVGFHTSSIGSDPICCEEGATATFDDATGQTVCVLPASSKTFTSVYAGEFTHSCDAGIPYCVSATKPDTCEAAGCSSTRNYRESTAIDGAAGIDCDINETIVCEDGGDLASCTQWACQAS